MSGMPSGHNVSSPVEIFHERLEQLREKLQRKCADILTEKENKEWKLKN